MKKIDSQLLVCSAEASQRLIALGILPASTFCYQWVAGDEEEKAHFEFAEYNQALKLNPNDTNAYIYRGLAYYNKKEHADMHERHMDEIEKMHTKHEKEMEMGGKAAHGEKK